MQSQSQSQEWIFIKNEQKQKVVMIKYKYKYTNTNTNTRTQIQIRTHKYKYKYRGGLRSQTLTFVQNKKFSRKKAISLEPLDLHPLNTTQIESLGVLDLKNTSGGL